MDINSISAQTTSLLSQQRVGDAVGITVQKKAQQIQTESAVALINSVPKADSVQSSQNLPSHLGQNINVTA